MTVKAYKYPPEQVFEIVTFEIKPRDQISVVGVFEALAHQQFANRSYVLYHTPPQNEDDGFVLEDLPEGDRIFDTARKYGVGIILAGDMSDFDTWTTILAPEYKSPDPENSNFFVSACFSETNQQIVTEWFG